MADLQAGLTHTSTFEVTRRMIVPELFPDDPATSRMPEVLATPFLVGLIERACMELLEPHFEPGEGSLGIGMDLRHLAPTLTGMKVSLDVRCVAVDKRKCSFEVEARDELAVIGMARHDRAVVVWERFNDRLQEMRDKLAKQ